MEEIFLKYGLPGAVIVALGWYVIKIEERHRKERKEWRESTEKQFDRIDRMNDESNKTLRENTNILSGLKSLLERQNRR